MNKNKTKLPCQQVNERQRAIVECGLLIDALADESPNIERIQATWQQADLQVRGAIKELCTLEQQAPKEEVK